MSETHDPAMLIVSAMLNDNFAFAEKVIVEWEGNLDCVVEGLSELAVSLVEHIAANARTESGEQMTPVEWWRFQMLLNASGEPPNNM